MNVDELPVRIVIGHRGWVWVGYYSQVGDWARIVNARCIRHWNTESGLAELCSGPGKAVLDAACVLRIHTAAIIGTYECDSKGWADALA